MSANRGGGEASLGQVLGELGGSGTSRMQLATSLLGKLGAAGFGGGNFKALGAQLKHALASFQRAQGLPVTGKLDPATLNALQKAGLAPRSEQAGAAKDAFTLGTTPGLGAGGEAAALPQGEAPPTPGELKAGLLAFTRGGMATGLQAGAGGGQAFGTGAPPPEHATNQTPGQKSEAQGGAASARADVVLTQAAASDVTDLSSRFRADTQGTKSPDGKGTDKGDLRADKGRGKKGDGDGRYGGGEEADGAPEDDEQQKGGLEDEEGGNTPSGDENFDDIDRGQAAQKDGSDDEAGHYQVAEIALQLRGILKRVVRDVDDDNRAATYSLEVQIFRPGIYGRGQMPEVLLNAAVLKANAYDPAWDELLEGLEAFARRQGCESGPPSRAELEMAIRLARYKHD